MSNITAVQTGSGWDVDGPTEELVHVDTVTKQFTSTAAQAAVRGATKQTVRWVELTDSRGAGAFQDTYSTNRIRQTSSRGMWPFLQAISGNAFQLANTACVSGNKIADALARFDSAVLGAMFSGGSPSATNPGVSPFAPDIVGVELDVNDFINATPLADMQSQATDLIQRCAAIGAWCVWRIGRAPMSGAAGSGYGAAWRGRQLAFWEWLKSQQYVRPNLVVVDLFPLTVSPSDANGYCTQALMHDTSIHPNANGSRIAAQAVWAALVARGIVRAADWLPASTAEVYDATNAPSVWNRLSNPVLTGSTATASASGWSGTIPASYTPAATTNATVVASIVAAPSGIGNAIQLDITWTGAGGSVQILTPRIESLCAAGDRVKFGHELSYRGLNADGVTEEALVASHNLFGVSSTHRWQTAGGSSFFSNWGNANAADGSRFGNALNWHIWTPEPEPIDATPTRVDGYVTVFGGALTSGKCRVFIARPALSVNGYPAF